MMPRLFVTGLTVACSLVLAEDWPQWRGSNRTGISQEKGLLQEWPKEGPKQLWHVTGIGDGYGAPAVARGRIYVLANRGMDEEFVKALSADDGKTLWTTKLGAVGNPNQQPPYPMARSTPSIDGEFLYAFSSDGDLACLALASGKIAWQKNVRKEFGGTPGTWAYSESPLIDGDTVVVTPGGADATMLALNKKTGDLIWKSAIPGGDRAAYSSVIAHESAGRKQYIQFLDKGVVGVDAKTGKFLWRYTQTSGGPANIATPIARGNYVYSTNARRFGGGLVQLTAVNDGITMEQVYFERDLPNSLGGQVLLGDFIYGTNPEGPVAAEFATGKIRWRSADGGPGAILYADGRLYWHLESGDVLLAEATPDAFREKGRFTPADQPKRRDSRERAWSYPVVAGGKLYIRDLDHLWCYDVRAK
ncbi:MAG TPA: PQQ-binding-like beta-propeller repeat protein [Bryobacteraceae bacterium]|nr:PQQ-binding-like beta-propeller repeat protein [Bryobacteraceae bacterium]